MAVDESNTGSSVAMDNAGNVIGSAAEVVSVVDNSTLSAEDQALLQDIMGQLDYEESVDPISKIRELSFPLEANRGNHFVKFFINIDEESALTKNNTLSFSDIVRAEGDVANNPMATPINSNTAAATGAAAGAALAASAALSRNLKKVNAYKGKGLSLPTQMAGGAALGALVASMGVEKLKLNKKLKRLGAAISLYIPAGISASYSMSYEGIDYKLASLLRGDEASKALEMIFTKPEMTVTRALAVGANPLLSSMSRTALNPKKDILFKEVQNRKFNFNYQFAPRNMKEAKAVADIIYMFKLFAHPEQIDSVGQFLYIYPAQFDIQYFTVKDNGDIIENKYLNKISSCVLESINVSYADYGSYQSLAAGEPIMTNVSLQFREIETLHQGRIKVGY